MNDVAELHLFILWSAARSEETRILSDLAKTFEIIRIVEVSWGSETFAESLTRFYGLLLPPGSFKENHVGTGPFLLVVVRDRAPLYAITPTSRGEANVNTTVFAAKARYRDWTGGGHKIHATNSPAEFDHDIALLLGRNAEDYEAGVFPEFAVDDGSSSLEIDLAGAKGWESLRHLFYIFNATIPYVVLRNFEVLPDAYYAGTHGDIDLLVANFEEASYLARAKRVFAEDYRVHVGVDIAGEEVLFDFRSVGDGYYDRTWEERMLASAAVVRGVALPTQEDHFYGLLYHALIHKDVIASDYIESFAKLAPRAIVGSQREFQEEKASEMLGMWMAENGFKIRVPERSVRFNSRNAGQVQRHISRFRPPGWRLALVTRSMPRVLPRVRRGLHRVLITAPRRVVGTAARTLLGEARWVRIRARLGIR